MGRKPKPLPPVTYKITGLGVATSKPQLGAPQATQVTKKNSTVAFQVVGKKMLFKVTAPTISTSTPAPIPAPTPPSPAKIMQVTANSASGGSPSLDQSPSFSSH